MFTGLIEETGKIESISNSGMGRTFVIAAKKVIEGVKKDDSIAINGACLTVVKFDSRTFTVEAVDETIRKTTLHKLHSGSEVNLERAMMVGDRLGGHIVQGHIDCTGKILTIQSETVGKLVKVQFPKNFSRYIVLHGSVCIDGVSLTVARLADNDFTVSIIPHTWENTILKNYKTGTEVNLEFDILGKYVERLLSVSGEGKSGSGSVFDQYFDQPI
jgi:riboflavin synthase